MQDLKMADMIAGVEIAWLDNERLKFGDWKMTDSPAISTPAISSVILQSCKFSYPLFGTGQTARTLCGG